MKKRTIEELKEYYNVDLDKAVLYIKKNNIKKVLLQFPDGLKMYSTIIADFLENKTNSDFFIYFGQCFGACDTPYEIKNTGIDLIIQFGHNELMPTY